MFFFFFFVVVVVVFCFLLLCVLLFLHSSRLQKLTVFVLSHLYVYLDLVESIYQKQ